NLSADAIITACICLMIEASATSNPSRYRGRTRIADKHRGRRPLVVGDLLERARHVIVMRGSPAKKIGGQIDLMDANQRIQVALDSAFDDSHMFAAVDQIPIDMDGERNCGIMAFKGRAYHAFD